MRFCLSQTTKRSINVKSSKSIRSTRWLYGLTFLSLLLLSLPMTTWAFCGFYVAKADTKLFNEASQVVMVRDGKRNVLTMASDYQGDAKDFALVVPVPTVLKREQIHITDNAIIEHLDAYSAPRLVEYYDSDPCMMRRYKAMPMAVPSPAKPVAESMADRADSLGVKIEAQYTVGEYNILLLSAKESGGLTTWLTEQGYKLPKGAEPVISSYLKQDMKFFVAKVNLKKFAKSGYTRLRPIQIAYEHQRFMIPIRLGTVNSKGKQEVFIYALTRKGRVESTNYRTVKLPSNVEVPAYIKQPEQFSRFYKDMFRHQVEKERGKAVFLEYAWDMNWCDPCAADPLSDKELKELGVFWLDQANQPNVVPPPNAGTPPPMVRPAPMPSAARDVYISRLHVRYDQQNFPEDLLFQVTGNRENYQGRYIIRHPWKGKATCDAAETYLNKTLPERQNQRAKTLANLTGWDITEIRQMMNINEPPKPKDDEEWWQGIWDD
jgi:hypothetical protein